MKEDIDDHLAVRARTAAMKMGAARVRWQRARDERPNMRAVGSASESVGERTAGRGGDGERHGPRGEQAHVTDIRRSLQAVTAKVREIWPRRVFCGGDGDESNGRLKLLVQKAVDAIVEGRRAEGLRRQPQEAQETATATQGSNEVDTADPLQVGRSPRIGAEGLRHSGADSVAGGRGGSRVRRREKGLSKAKTCLEVFFFREY